MNKMLDLHFYAPPKRHIIGIEISGNPVDHIETTITLLIFIKEGQNFWSNFFSGMSTF